jgi:hypothetical protein
MRSRGEAKSARREEKLREQEIQVPGDPTNEQVVLAAEMVDKEVRRRVLREFPPDAFIAEEHRAIQAALGELEKRGLDYDPATVQRLAPDINVALLELLAESRPDVPPNLDFHLATLRWDWRRAQFARGPFGAMVEAIQDAKTDPARLAAIASSMATFFKSGDAAAPFLRDPEEVVRAMMQTIDQRIAGEAYYPFGIDGLDMDEAGRRRVRPGTMPGIATILTGMSGAGKTSLAAHGILGVARQKRRVLVGAWEVRAPMTLELVTTLSLKWSRTRVLDGLSNEIATDAPMTRDERDEFMERGKAISRYVRFVDNPFRRGSIRAVGRVTNDDYLDILEHHIETSGAEVVVLDLFDRCLRDREPNDEQEALWRMLEMADRLQIHLVIVHQQLLKGRDVRADKKPSLAGLKGSSAYVDSGNAIIAPHIPARFKDVPDDTFEVYGLKMRNGPPWAIEFGWDPDTGQLGAARTMRREELNDDDSRAPSKILGVKVDKTKAKKM